MAHDAQMAIFELADKKTHVEISIKFETYDLTHVWSDFKDLDLIEQNDLLHTYLIATTKWKFNTVPADLCNVEIRVDQNHTILKGIFYVDPKKIKKIEVYNICFLSTFKEQINLVNFDLHDRFRGFRMDKNRKNIQVEYPD